MKRLTVALLLPFLLPIAVAAATTPTQIAVSGTGTVTTLPDQATVNATVTTNATAAATAVSQNSATYDRVVAALVAGGIARSNITLSSYYVNYNPPPSNPSPSVQYGFTVQRSFSIKTGDISMAGNIVDTATRAGATQIDGVSFGLADDASARRTATQKALDDARTSAYAVAAGSHLRVIGISSITVNGAFTPSPQPMMFRAAAQSTPTTFENSNVTVTVSVNVVYLAVP